jgi:hypothetical protein
VGPGESTPFTRLNAIRASCSTEYFSNWRYPIEDRTNSSGIFTSPTTIGSR